jgi:hypothetical protein
MKRTVHPWEDDMATSHITNQIADLSFSGQHIVAQAVEDARWFHVRDRSIVVNVGMTAAPIVGHPTKVIRPLNSTILQDAVIESAERLVCLSVAQLRNVGRIIFEPGWALYWDVLVKELGLAGAAATGYQKQTPLWRSSQDTIGTVSFDPHYITGQRVTPISLANFVIRVNLWFAPEHTDCAIHNRHDFIEVHTQVYGMGRMQKFRESDITTLYQDIVMGPGYTTPDPFCWVTDDSTYHYPWHQYYSDTDCIWLAVEYHPA